MNIHEHEITYINILCTMVVLAEYHHPAFPVGNHWQKRTQKMKITVVPGGGLLANVRHRKT